MNLKQLITFGIEESQEPVIKNPVMRAALQEPRTMAQEPRNMYASGQLVQNTADGSRPGYKGTRQPSSQKTGTMYKKLLKNLPDGYLEDYKRLFLTDNEDGTFSRKAGDAIEGGKAFMEKKYGKIVKKIKTRQGEVKNMSRKIQELNSSILKSFNKDNKIVTALDQTDLKRGIRIKKTAPLHAKGTKEFPFHHIMQIGGEVPLTTNDIAIISREMNAKLSPHNKNLNNIADAISKNITLSFEAMNAKNEGLALDYLKRVDELNNNAEQIVNKAVKELPKEYKQLIGFNKFYARTDEYGFPLDDKVRVEKVGGVKTKDKAINLADLNKNQKSALIKQVKLDAKKGIVSKSFKDVVNNSKKGGALLTNNILSKGNFKPKCKTKFANGGGGLCGKAFAEADPQAYLDEVMKDLKATKYLQSKEALTVGRSFLNKAAKVGSWANPLTLVGGEAWYSVLAGYNEWGKGASLGEAVNEGLWFIPGKHSRDLDILLGKDKVTKEGRNLPAISKGDRNQFDLLTQLGGLINEEGKLSGQLFMQQLETGRLEDVKAKSLWEERFAPEKAFAPEKSAADIKLDYENMKGDIQWSKDIITPQIEERHKNVMTEGEGVVKKWQTADPEGQSYPELQDKIKDFIVNKYNKGRTFDLADPYSGPVWNWTKRSFEKINPFDDDKLTKKQKELDYQKLTGQLEDQPITKENIPPELIENFLTKFPEYSYIFEGAEGGIASLMKKKW